MCKNNIIFFGKGKLINLIKTMDIYSSVHVIDNDFEELDKKIKENNMYNICLIMDTIDFKYLDEFEKNISSSSKYLCIFMFFKYTFITQNKRKIDSGCAECMFDRWIMTKKDRKELFNIKKYLQENLNKVEITNVTRSLVNIIMNLVKIKNYCNIRGIIINNEDLSYTVNRYMPISTCQRCGRILDDDENNVFQEFNRCLTEENKSYRKYNLDFLKKILKENYLNKDTGIFNFLLDDIETSFAVSVANLPIKNGNDEVGVGRTNNYCVSQTIAILEGLERYCGMEPRGIKTIINESYNELEEKALNPIKLGLHSKQQYEQEKFQFKKYNYNQRINWVWGYSITNKETILVPESIGYYGINIRDSLENRFVYEISNGCSIGGSLLEACMHGLFEVIERDAFLIVWYTKMPLQSICIADIENKEIRLMVKKFEYNFQYRIHLFDMTLDTKVPAVFIVAKNMNKDNRMNIMCSAGCHMSYDKAIEGALHELCGIIPALNKKFVKRYNELKKMYLDFDLVKSMEDHSLLYGLKEAEEAFDFLLKQENNIKTYKDSKLKYSGDLKHDFESIILSLKELNLDVISVNQTAEELKYCDLHCVKMIVPGMLPMTFGHKYRRVYNLERLFTVPLKMGHAVKNIDDLKRGNVLPHPFP